MFPAPALQRGNELVIHFSDEEEDCVNNHQISQDRILLLNNNHPDSHNNNKFASTSSNNNLIFYGGAGASHDHQQQEQQVGPNKNKERKMVHREIEKQRRKYMATLHASLRSLLPLQFIKGKRSVSDQMNEAVNYIKHLQENVKELSAKRDELKKQYEISNSRVFSVEQSSNKNGGSEVGIEVTASGFRDNQETVIPLSKLLQLLFEEGLEVVTCLSTHVNGTLLHTLHCQVKNSDSVDLSELRRKFANIVPSFRCSN